MPRSRGKGAVKPKKSTRSSPKQPSPKAAGVRKAAKKQQARRGRGRPRKSSPFKPVRKEVKETVEQDIELFGEVGGLEIVIEDDEEDSQEMEDVQAIGHDEEDIQEMEDVQAIDDEESEAAGYASVVDLATSTAIPATVIGDSDAHDDDLAAVDEETSEILGSPITVEELLDIPQSGNVDVQEIKTVDIQQSGNVDVQEMEIETVDAQPSANGDVQEIEMETVDIQPSANGDVKEIEEIKTVGIQQSGNGDVKEIEEIKTVGIQQSGNGDVQEMETVDAQHTGVDSKVTSSRSPSPAPEAEPAKLPSLDDPSSIDNAIAALLTAPVTRHDVVLRAKNTVTTWATDSSVLLRSENGENYQNEMIVASARLSKRSRTDNQDDEIPNAIISHLLTLEEVKNIIAKYPLIVDCPLKFRRGIISYVIEKCPIGQGLTRMEMADEIQKLGWTLSADTLRNDIYRLTTCGEIQALPASLGKGKKKQYVSKGRLNKTMDILSTTVPTVASGKKDDIVEKICKFVHDKTAMSKNPNDVLTISQIYLKLQSVSNGTEPVPYEWVESLIVELVKSRKLSVIFGSGANQRIVPFERFDAIVSEMQCMIQQEIKTIMFKCDEPISRSEILVRSEVVKTFHVDVVDRALAQMVREKVISQRGDGRNATYILAEIEAKQDEITREKIFAAIDEQNKIAGVAADIGMSYTDIQTKLAEQKAPCAHSHLVAILAALVRDGLLGERRERNGKKIYARHGEYNQAIQKELSLRCEKIIEVLQRAPDTPLKCFDIMKSKIDSKDVFSNVNSRNMSDALQLLIAKKKVVMRKDKSYLLAEHAELVLSKEADRKEAWNEQRRQIILDCFSGSDSNGIPKLLNANNVMLEVSHYIEKVDDDGKREDKRINLLSIQKDLLRLERENLLKSIRPKGITGAKRYVLADREAEAQQSLKMHKVENTRTEIEPRIIEILRKADGVPLRQTDINDRLGENKIGFLALSKIVAGLKEKGVIMALESSHSTYVLSEMEDNARDRLKRWKTGEIRQLQIMKVFQNDANQVVRTATDIRKAIDGEIHEKNPADGSRRQISLSAVHSDLKALTSSNKLLAIDPSFSQGGPPMSLQRYVLGGLSPHVDARNRPDQGTVSLNTDGPRFYMTNPVGCGLPDKFDLGQNLSSGTVELDLDNAPESRFHFGGEVQIARQMGLAWENDVVTEYSVFPESSADVGFIQTIQDPISKYVTLETLREGSPISVGAIGVVCKSWLQLIEPSFISKFSMPNDGELVSPHVQFFTTSFRVIDMQPSDVCTTDAKDITMQVRARPLLHKIADPIELKVRRGTPCKIGRGEHGKLGISEGAAGIAHKQAILYVDKRSSKLNLENRQKSKTLCVLREFKYSSRESHEGILASNSSSRDSSRSTCFVLRHGNTVELMKGDVIVIDGDILLFGLLGGFRFESSVSATTQSNKRKKHPADPAHTSDLAGGSVQSNNDEMEAGVANITETEHDSDDSEDGYVPVL